MTQEVCSHKRKAKKMRKERDGTEAAGSKRTCSKRRKNEGKQGFYFYFYKGAVSNYGL